VLNRLPAQQVQSICDKYGIIIGRAYAQPQSTQQRDITYTSTRTTRNQERTAKPASSYVGTALQTTQTATVRDSDVSHLSKRVLAFLRDKRSKVESREGASAPSARQTQFMLEAVAIEFKRAIPSPTPSLKTAVAASFREEVGLALTEDGKVKPVGADTVTITNDALVRLFVRLEDAVRTKFGGGATTSSSYVPTPLKVSSREGRQTRGPETPPQPMSSVGGVGGIERVRSGGDGGSDSRVESAETARTARGPSSTDALGFNRRGGGAPSRSGGEGSARWGDSENSSRFR
tara:strand:- start:401 stop:1270 length:870 start_codon:yes stop_codon:yes gene_type:complete